MRRLIWVFAWRICKLKELPYPGSDKTFKADFACDSVFSDFYFTVVQNNIHSSWIYDNTSIFWVKFEFKTSLLMLSVYTEGEWKKKKKKKKKTVDLKFCTLLYKDILIYIVKRNFDSVKNIYFCRLISPMTVDFTNPAKWIHKLHISFKIKLKNINKGN